MRPMRARSVTGGRGAGGRNTVDKIRSREPEEGEEGSSRGGP